MTRGDLDIILTGPVAARLTPVEAARLRELLRQADKADWSAVWRAFAATLPARERAPWEVAPCFPR